MPRTLWALLLTLAITLSGCSGDDDTDDGTGDGTGTTTGTESPTGTGTTGPTGPASERWYMHWPSDGGTGCTDAYMDHSASPGIECVYTAQTVATAAGPPWWTYPATAETVGFQAGSTVEGQIPIFHGGPYTGTLNVELMAGETVVGSASQTVGPGPGAMEEVVYEFSFQTTEDFDETTVLTFRYSFDTLGYMEPAGDTFIWIKPE